MCNDQYGVHKHGNTHQFLSNLLLSSFIFDTSQHHRYAYEQFILPFPSLTKMRLNMDGEENSRIRASKRRKYYKVRRSGRWSQQHGLYFGEFMLAEGTTCYFIRLHCSLTSLSEQPERLNRVSFSTSLFSVPFRFSASFEHVHHIEPLSFLICFTCL